MRLGVFGINSGATCGPADSAATARLAEQLGFDSVWAGEHVVVPSPRVAPSPMEPTDPILDPLVHLAFVAAVTERILVATGIIILPQRNPLVLAKQVASLDVLSGGRFLLGVGAGYLEPEMTAIGVPMADRGTRTDDHVAAMRAVWSQPGRSNTTAPTSTSQASMPILGPYSRAVHRSSSVATHRRRFAGRSGWAMAGTGSR